MNTLTKTDWTKPQQTSALSQAFGDIRGLMPDYQEIPEDFRRERGDSRKWHRIQSEWFFRGLPNDTVFKPKDGVDQQAALGHLKCIQGSFQPKHEHKQAAVAWLMSLWFDDIVPEKAPA